MDRERALRPLFDAGDRAFAIDVVTFAFANPFGPKPAQAERAALGSAYVDTGPVWIPRGKAAPIRENLRRIRARLEPLVGLLRQRLAAGVAASKDDLLLYTEVCLFFLYDRYAARFRTLLDRPAGKVEFYSDFAVDHAALGCLPGVALPAPELLFAFGFQIRRALHNIASTLLGGSPAAARLRVKVWESIFTRNLRRYLRAMYTRMDEITTLVMGASGTGKERVARGIGASRFLSFDPLAACFAAAESFHGLNLSALSRSVIESELFGHRRGAFTGALTDKQGLLELGGATLLDEIGEIGDDLQVLLLRVLQERLLQRVGDMVSRPLRTKLIAATHRDLEARVREGKFRLDLLMRLCADRIDTPSLRSILDDAPGERRVLVRHIAEAEVGPAEANEVTDEVEAWIDEALPPDHPWHGNIRELEQYVRNRLIHSSCRPLRLALGPADGEADAGVEADERVEAEGEAEADGESEAEAEADGEAEAEAEADGEDEAEAEADVSEDETIAVIRSFHDGHLLAEEVVGRYAAVVQAETGSYRETAKRLGIDRRRLLRSLDYALLARLVKQRGGGGDDGGGGGEDDGDGG